jgi:hypothetical protein
VNKAAVEAIKCAIELLDVRSEEKFKVFPNPSSDQVHINGGRDSYDKIVLRDMLGTFVNEFNQSDVLDVSSIPSGVYLLQFSLFGQPSIDTVLLTIQ